MTPTRPFQRAVAAAAAAGVLLTGCTGEPGTQASPTPSPTTSATATQSVSPTPTSTLSAAKQRALDEATEAVRAYEQMIYDILASPSPRLNDMNDVAAQPQLDLDLRSLQGIVVAGKTTVETTGPVLVISVEPVKINLKGDPPSVTVVACVDRSANSGTEDGKPWKGLRQESQYRVEKTDYLPEPGWAISKVLPPKGHDQPQPC